LERYGAVQAINNNYISKETNFVKINFHLKPVVDFTLLFTRYFFFYFFIAMKKYVCTFSSSIIIKRLE